MNTCPYCEKDMGSVPRDYSYMSCPHCDEICITLLDPDGNRVEWSKYPTPHAKYKSHWKRYG